MFDVRTTALKQEWITLLQVHSSRPQTGNGHIARYVHGGVLCGGGKETRAVKKILEQTPRGSVRGSG